VRWNGAALVLHQIGHVLGAGHDAGGDSAMAPFSFDAERESVPRFDATLSGRFRREASRIPEEDGRPRPLGRLWFYLVSVARNPMEVATAVVQSRALTLPLSLPKLSTAALVPTLVVVFSAETWDVGLNITDGTAALFAVGSILLAAVYLLFSHNLLFPARAPTGAHRTRRAGERHRLLHPPAGDGGAVPPGRGGSCSPSSTSSSRRT